jgi:hypothetical protein
VRPSPNSSATCLPVCPDSYASTTAARSRAVIRRRCGGGEMNRDGLSVTCASSCTSVKNVFGLNRPRATKKVALTRSNGRQHQPAAVSFVNLVNVRRSASVVREPSWTTIAVRRANEHRSGSLCRETRGERGILRIASLGRGGSDSASNMASKKSAGAVVCRDRTASARSSAGR